MAQAVLDDKQIAIKEGDITVYNFDGTTREYLFTTIEYLARGVGIPASSCTDAPGDEKTGYAICRTADFAAWEYIPDHRGETVYSTETGSAVIISLPGDYPEGTTTLAPSTQYDKWNGIEWVTDTEAQHTADVEAAEKHKSALLAEAQATISLWQTELQLGIISDEDKASLIGWVNYIKSVKALDVTTAPDIIWPAQPAV